MYITLILFCALTTIISARPQTILDGHSTGKDIYGATPLEMEIFVPHDADTVQVEEEEDVSLSSEDETEANTTEVVTRLPDTTIATTTKRATTTTKIPEKRVTTEAPKKEEVKEEVEEEEEDEDDVEKMAVAYFSKINLNIMVGEASEATGIAVQNALLNEVDGPPELLGNYLEGDLLIPTSSQSRPGGVMTSSRWPMGIVPFIISNNYSVSQLAPIYTAMVKIQEATCVQFVQRQQQDDYVHIVNTNTGCWSAVGRIGGEQLLSLQGDGCLRSYSSALHVFLHMLGFLHEHNRPERDDHVTVHWENVRIGSRLNFQKNCASSGFGVEYDLRSIMHFPTSSYSTNGNATITAKEDTTADKMTADRTDLSQGDILKINRLYDCKDFLNADNQL